MSAVGCCAAILCRLRVAVICCALMLGWSLPLGASPQTAPALSFSNLGRVVQLTLQGDAYQLALEEGAIQVRIANRLLVRAVPAIDADTLRHAVPGSGSARQLARLSDSVLWLLTLDEAEPVAALRMLERQPGVLHVQPDLLQIRQPAAMVGAGTRDEFDAGQSGPPPPPSVDSPHAARVAVIDDGFDLTHTAFAGVDVLLQYDAGRHVADAGPAGVIDSHGTQVAGLIVAAADAGHPGGLAPDAGLIAIRQVSTWTSDMVLAFSVARMMQADVVNASWTLAWLPEPVYTLLIDWQRDAQPPYLVVAAGNAHGDACRLNALASVPGAWLVGARGPDGRTLRYSNHGPCVDLHAPARFTSTLPGQAYGSFTGTSAAAAHVSAVLAREIGRGARPDLRAVQTLLQAETSPRAAP